MNNSVVIKIVSQIQFNLQNLTKLKIRISSRINHIMKVITSMIMVLKAVLIIENLLDQGLLPQKALGIQ